jgi:hypothetical protein
MNGYPKSYRGFDVSVSFGQGNLAQIPWIAFLGPGQKTSNGIYPVYLFYREIDLLILAYPSNSRAVCARFGFGRPERVLKNWS